MAIKQQMRNAIKQAILADKKSIEDIAGDYGVSRSSVKRIKKEMADSELDASQRFEQDNDNKLLARMQEKEQRKIKTSKMYEDTEEGWIFDITKTQIKGIGRSRSWIGIVYPESAPEDWKDQLINLNCELAISPLHNLDRWLHDSSVVVDDNTGEILYELGERYKSGDLKKSHWHFIIKTDKPMGFKEINALIQPITNGPLVKKCLSVRGSYEYLAHMNEDPTKKYHYDSKQIERYNKFLIEPTKTDAAYMFNEIADVIDEYKYTNLKQVRQHYRDIPEYLIVIRTSAFAIQKLLDVEWHEQNPDGLIRRVAIVPDPRDEGGY